MAKQAKLDLESQYGKNIDEIDLYADVFNDGSKNEKLKDLGLEDTPLFENGPGTIQLQTWKKKWSDYDIYMIDILKKGLYLELLIDLNISNYCLFKILILWNVKKLYVKL
nr:hypothetical protein [Clostridioides difficile]